MVNSKLNLAKKKFFPFKILKVNLVIEIKGICLLYFQCSVDEGSFSDLQILNFVLIF